MTVPERNLGTETRLVSTDVKITHFASDELKKSFGSLKEVSGVSLKKSQEGQNYCRIFCISDAVLGKCRRHYYNLTHRSLTGSKPTNN